MTGRHVLRVDGGARGNPGPAAAAFVLEGPDGARVLSGGRPLGETTNNVAEYEALVWGLQTAAATGVAEIDVFADSELVVRQVQGKYRVKHGNMKPLYAEVMKLLGGFGEWSIAHVAREENADADALVNEVLDGGLAVGDATWPVGGGMDTLF